MTPRLLAVLGPTASGKTALAIALCRALGGEAISCDSMQIYREMNVGTAKPTPAESAGVPHHMIDVCDPGEEYSVARYVAEADACIREVAARGHVPVIVGGTGLYADALLSGCDFAAREEDHALRDALTARAEREGGEALLSELRGVDPVTAARLHPNDLRRIVRALEVCTLTGEPLSAHDARTRARPPRYEALRFVLSPEPREYLYARIDARVEEMFSAGLEEEARGVLSRGLSARATALQAIGYKELDGYFRGEQTLAEAKAAIAQGTRRYAKRQLTWFRREDAERLSYASPEEFADCTARAIALAEAFLKGKENGKTDSVCE